MTKPSYKSQLRHRIRLENKRLKRLQSLVTSAPTWVDHILSHVGTHHNKSELTAIRALISGGHRNPLAVAPPHGRGLHLLAEAGIVVISEGFAVLAKKEDLAKLYNHGKTTQKGKSAAHDESQARFAARCSHRSKKKKASQEPVQQGRGSSDAHQGRQDTGPIQDSV